MRYDALSARSGSEKLLLLLFDRLNVVMWREAPTAGA